MKPLLPLLCMLLFAGFCSANTADLSDELASKLKQEELKYINQIKTLKGKPLHAAADLISGTGINSPELFQVVETRLQKLFSQHKRQPKHNQVNKEITVLLRTYASLSPESEPLISEILHTSNNKGIRERANRLLPKLYWYVKRNELMRDTTTYQPGQDLMTHRFINLVNYKDPRMGRWVAQEIYRRDGAEVVVYQAMSKKLADQYLDIKNSLHLDELAWYCKILKQFYNEESSKQLQQIVQNPKADKKLIRYAK